MEVKIKKLVKEAIIPKYAKTGDAGMDLVATSVSNDEYGNVVYGTGIALEIPEGYVGLIFPRSSNAKKDIALTNCVGVIDSGYRGEILFKFRPTKKIFFWKKTKIYEVGERIGQIIIMPYPRIDFDEVEKLSESSRGDDAYGSTGK